MIVSEHAAATVAALYVDPQGVYANLPDVEVWDEARDARLYAGPWPVVAHPPCQRWCMLAGLVEHMYGYKRGEDGGTFAAALAAVRRFGGVLEHPAYSAAWREYDLPRPGRYGWTGSLIDPGFATEVDQAVYGHPCRKRTWLYAVDVQLSALRWESPSNVTEQVSDFFGHPKGSWMRSSRGTGMTHGESSASPPAFRDVLLQMARTAGRVAA